MINNQWLIVNRLYNYKELSEKSKTLFFRVQIEYFQILFYWKLVVLDSVVGVICKSPFMNKIFQTASFLVCNYILCGICF